MWFKQAQIFKLSTPITENVETLSLQLQPLAFRPCLPSFPFSYGWVPPIEEEGGKEAALVHKINNCLLICLQFEEKILPMSIVRQELNKKVKELEVLRDKKMSRKEKYTLKEEITHTLLPKAFSKLSAAYAYMDIKNSWLVLDTTNASRTDKFMTHLKKSLPDLGIEPIVATKLAPTLTQWLLHQNYPQIFSVEKSCVLNDVQQKNRVIRCQQQNLFANGIRSFIEDSCQVKQLALCWQDSIQFVLTEKFFLLSVKFPEKISEQSQEMEPETKQQQFMADFFIMTGIFSGLLKDLFDALPAEE
jgi:recombination associated protein RdgC